jgi:hypothetical protein
MRNKAKKAKKHQKKLLSQQERSAQRLSLLKEVRDKVKMPVGALQKKYGTLNIRRLTDILEDRVETSIWYRARVARKEAELLQSKVVKRHVKFHKHKKDKGSQRDGAVSKISRCTNGRDEEVQVDPQ